MGNAYILAAFRTPGTKAKKGKLKDVRPDNLAAAAIKGLLERTGVDPAGIDDVIMGCAFPEAEQGMNMARIAALKAGVPYQVPAQTVNRFCSSGLQTIASAANVETKWSAASAGIAGALIKITSWVGSQG